MENKKRKSTGLLLSILGVISLVLITAGVTYAFFSYAKQGETENTITTGSITFVYNENGTALNITDALPKSDNVAIEEHNAANSNAFTFQVTSTTPSTAYINYIVTARMDHESTLPDSQVKLYLTATGSDDGTTGITPGTQTGITAGNISTYYNLTDVSHSSFSYIFGGNNTAPTFTDGTKEKVIYIGQVPAATQANGGSYTKDFKLSMWLLGANGGTCTGYNTQEAPTTEQACTAASGQWSASTTGMADYSAFEFVNLSKLTVTGGTCTNYGEGEAPATSEACATANGTWTPSYSATALSVDSLAETTDWMRSVPYYAGLNATPATVQAANWTRIAYVNYTTKQIITVAQKNTPGFTAPTGEGWVESEQYYPLNGGEFKVTINVYAEGATTYSVPSNG